MTPAGAGQLALAAPAVRLSASQAELPATVAAAADALLQGLPAPAWLVALDSRDVVAANAAAHALLGCAVPALVGQPALSLVASPEDLAWWDTLDAASSSGRPPDPLLSDTVVCTHDGRALHVTRSIRPVALLPGRPPAHLLVMLADRSAEHEAERRREDLLAELRATLEATGDGILVTDLAGRIRAFNRRLAEMWGLPLALLQEHDDAAVQAWMERSVGDSAAYRRRLQVLSQAPLSASTDRIELVGGQVLERVARPLFNAGRPQGRVWSFRDLTERLAAEQRIEVLTLSDALTGLANRRRLTERVAELLSQGPRAQRRAALLVVDLDHFRRVNDSLGDERGNQVLQEVAQRIQSCLRGEDLLARLGGDQFAVLVSPADAAIAEATARRVLAVVAQPSSMDGAPFTLTCSVGAALAPAHGNCADDLVRHAEAAMREAKANGRANWRLHQQRGTVDLRSMMQLDHAMRQALVSNRFRLVYQPQVELRDGRVVGAEALLRWRDPERGDVPPSRFIPVAEDSGFIVPIGDWVLAQAVRQAALWHGRGLEMPVAVNVSALQFQQAHFVERVAGVLAVSALPPHLLELELTESILVRDADEALARLQALARLGVRLSIDDFGTGYSSLAYLKRFPIGKLKIDRSFVSGLPADGRDAGIVRAILQMARALGMKVIAEGVETEEQRAYLREAGCDEFQGFLFAPALDPLSFEQRQSLGPSGAKTPPPTARIRLVRG